MIELRSKVIAIHKLLDELPENSKKSRYGLYLLFVLDSLAILLNLGLLYGIFYLYLQDRIHIGWCVLALSASILIKLLLSYLKIRHKAAILERLGVVIAEKSFFNLLIKQNGEVNKSVFRAEQLSGRIHHCLTNYFELFANLLLFFIALLLLLFKATIIFTLLVYIILITVVLNRLNHNREKAELLSDKYLLKKRSFIRDVLHLKDRLKAIGQLDDVPTKFSRINTKQQRLKRRVIEFGLSKAAVVEVFTVFYLIACFLLWTMLYDKQQVLSLLAIMVLLTAQLFPRAIKVIHSYHNMQDSFSFVDKYFALKEAKESKGYQAQGMLSYDQQGLNIKHLSLRYGERILLDDAAIRLPSKGHFILKAPNGAGKSTLLKWLVEQIAATSTKTYYIPQWLHIYHGTILENIKLFAADYDQAKVQQALNLSGFAKVMQDKSYTLSSIVSNRQLSGGEKTKLILAGMLYQRENVEVLLIDEAAASLDKVSKQLFYQTLTEQMADKLIIEVSHQPDDNFNRQKIVIEDHKLQLQTRIRE